MVEETHNNPGMQGVTNGFEELSLETPGEALEKAKAKITELEEIIKSQAEAFEACEELVQSKEELLEAE